jgi:zinc D-Ala-D-Ala carboxypeptidase
VKQLAMLMMDKMHRPLSLNFNYNELACPCCNDMKCPDYAISALQDLRNLLRRPLQITSAYRCSIHNATVHGAPNSRHLKGDAFDISTLGWSEKEIDDLKAKAWECGFKGIGTAKTFIHIDMRSLPTSWTY